MAWKCNVKKKIHFDTTLPKSKWANFEEVLETRIWIDDVLFSIETHVFPLSIIGTICHCKDKMESHYHTRKGGKSFDLSVVSTQSTFLRSVPHPDLVFPVWVIRCENVPSQGGEEMESYFSFSVQIVKKSTFK